MGFACFMHVVAAPDFELQFFFSTLAGTYDPLYGVSLVIRRVLSEPLSCVYMIWQGRWAICDLTGGGKLGFRYWCISRIEIV